MLSKFILFAMLALLATIALGLPKADKHIVVLHTDDSERLSKTNILPLLQHVDTIDSRNQSYDGTGLKLAGIHFHKKHHSGHNMTINTTDSHTDAVSTPWVAARCKPNPTCATENKLKYTSAAQASLLGGSVCPFITQKLDMNIMSVSRLLIEISAPVS